MDPCTGTNLLAASVFALAAACVNEPHADTQPQAMLPSESGTPPTASQGSAGASSIAAASQPMQPPAQAAPPMEPQPPADTSTSGSSAPAPQQGGNSAKVRQASAQPPVPTTAVSIQSVTLMWGQVPLGATLYLPSSRAQPVPGVVTGPGFAGVKEMLIPAFATAAAEAGIATLAIDYAGFGDSGGDPRQHVDPPAQVEQFGVALDSLAENLAIDPKRLGVWGTSLSGGHALAVAASDPRIKCAVAIIPFVGVSDTAVTPDVAALVAADAVAVATGQPGGKIPAVGRPGEVAVMTTDGAWEWSEAITADAPNWRNEVTLASLLEMSTYTPAARAASIAIPVRAILATNDSITPAALAREALSDVPHLDIVERPDTHFELFRDRLEDTIKLTTEWLAMHL